MPPFKYLGRKEKQIKGLAERRISHCLAVLMDLEGSYGVTTYLGQSSAQTVNVLKAGWETLALSNAHFVDRIASLSSPSENISPYYMQVELTRLSIKCLRAVPPSGCTKSSSKFTGILS